MSGWTLHFNANPSATVDASQLLPCELASLTKDRLARVQITVGSRHAALASLFEISGEACEDQLTIDNANHRLIRVGAGMKTGHLKVNGSVGYLAGCGMRGGRLSIVGDGGDYLGSGLSGGLIRVSGNAGNFVAGAQPGHRYGMRGGSIIVHGNVGDRLADRLRRGTIIVAGDCGDYAASRVVAGTIVIGGQSGRSPATGMRRGTLFMTSSKLKRTSALPGYEPSGPMSTTFAALLFASIDELYGDSNWRAHTGPTSVKRWVGDRRVEGRAELLQSQS